MGCLHEWVCQQCGDRHVDSHRHLWCGDRDGHCRCGVRRPILRQAGRSVRRGGGRRKRPAFTLQTTAGDGALENVFLHGFQAPVGQITRAAQGRGIWRIVNGEDHGTFPTAREAAAFMIDNMLCRG